MLTLCHTVMGRMNLPLLSHSCQWLAFKNTLSSLVLVYKSYAVAVSSVVVRLNSLPSFTNQSIVRAYWQTAYAVGFCLYNLSCNVDKQARLSLELDQVLPFLDSESRPPSVTEDKLAQLRYLKACVKESFR